MDQQSLSFYLPLDDTRTIVNLIFAWQKLVIDSIEVLKCYEPISEHQTINMDCGRHILVRFA